MSTCIYLLAAYNSIVRLFDNAYVDRLPTTKNKRYVASSTSSTRVLSSTAAETMTMTNGNKRDKTNNKSTITTPTRKEVQRRRKDGSNDTTDAEIDDQVRMLGKPPSAVQDLNGRQEKQTTLNKFIMGAEKKVLLPKSFFAGRINDANHAYRQLHSSIKKHQEGFGKDDLYGEEATTFHTMSNGCRAVIEQPVRDRCLDEIIWWFPQNLLNVHCGHKWLKLVSHAQTLPA